MKRGVLRSMLAVTALGAGAWQYCVGFNCVLGKSNGFVRDDAMSALAPSSQTPAIDDADAWALSIAQDAGDDVPSIPAPITIAQQMAQLDADARSDDVETRAAAIDALSHAPKRHAVPLLQRLLSATLEADRQHVLGALHTIAVEQGDEDGQIGDVLRLTIYDGDDAGVADNAQTILDGIQPDTPDT